ncbi:MAG: homocysteine S-methyltransferase family protein [Isosphaeraceae bacterium]
MNRLSRWRVDEPVLSDGAWGTELQKRGLPLGSSSDLWNLERPAEVESLARRYAEAGSRVVLTNTFQANALSLARFGAEALLDEVNRQGVALARSGAPGLGIFGSIGPTGGLDRYGPEAVARAFRGQVHALAGAGVDALVLETFLDVAEALLALEVARPTGLPVVISLTFDTDQRLRGATPEEVGRLIADAGADAVGLNCVEGPELVSNLCSRLREGSRLPVWVKPNAGTPRIEIGQPVYAISAEEFGEYWTLLESAGAAFIGGCCGAGPDHVRALAERRSPRRSS